MLDGTLLEQGLDPSDVIPVVMGEPDFAEPDPSLVDCSQHWVGLRRVDDRSSAVLDHQIRVVVAQTWNGDHLHRRNHRTLAMLLAILGSRLGPWAEILYDTVMIRNLSDGSFVDSPIGEALTSAQSVRKGASDEGKTGMLFGDRIGAGLGL